eukprot:TRINITY_DN9303_c0_g1_i1.p1 TRINITY_DN9303_c0_g1~~TRINITY_DN9303_c0_g1_i1.p1  ORF type:complete len:182 (+),score=14.45 TRINITY_DN9303_c0_g1_i1:17-562(+)
MLRLTATKVTRRTPQRRNYSIETNPEVGPEKRIYLSSRDYIGGRRIVKEVGFVSASSVQTKSFFHDLLSRVRGFFGGEVDFYSQLVNTANADATRRLQKEAIKAGADSVVSVKLQSSATSDPTAGVFVYSSAYGTAVKTLPDEDAEAAPDQLIEQDAIDGVKPHQSNSSRSRAKVGAFGRT